MARDHYEELTNHAVSVGSGAAVLLTSQRVFHKRNATLVQNLGADIVYIGGPTVTSSTGIRLAANEHITIEGPVILYGRSVGTSDVRVVEFE